MYKEYVKIPLPAGSLLIMEGATQLDWQVHSLWLMYSSTVLAGTQDMYNSIVLAGTQSMYCSTLLLGTQSMYNSTFVAAEGE